MLVETSLEPADLPAQRSPGDARREWSSPARRIVAALGLAALVAASGQLLTPAAHRPVALIRPADAVTASVGISPVRSSAGPAAHRSGPVWRPPTYTAAHRFVPTGTGMWLYQWDHTAGGNARAVVAKARQVGLHTLYVRTGSTWDGFTPDALGDLLAATTGTNISLVAWDFPALANPRGDALRLAHAAWYRRHDPGQPHVVAVAPDIETSAEGTHLSTAAVATYLATLRSHLPPDVSILGTVPWPSQYRIGRYPYHAVAHYSDALEPMTYWYTTNPGYVTARSVQYLSALHRPVLPIGQGYDERIDAPSLPRSHPGPELAKFVASAKHSGARAISLWVWQDAGYAQWHALAHARGIFGRR